MRFPAQNWKWSAVPDTEFSVGLSYPCLVTYAQDRSKDACRIMSREHAHVLVLGPLGQGFVRFGCETHAGLRMLLCALTDAMPNVFSTSVSEAVLRLSDAWRLPSGERTGFEDLQLRAPGFIRTHDKVLFSPHRSKRSKR